MPVFPIHQHPDKEWEIPVVDLTWACSCGYSTGFEQRRSDLSFIV
jgi:hypothetical protein